MHLVAHDGESAFERDSQDLGRREIITDLSSLIGTPIAPLQRPDTSTRRIFLTTALAVLGPGITRLAARRLMRIGLHSPRLQGGGLAVLTRSFEAVAALGFTDVEFPTPGGLIPDALAVRRALDRLGLSAPSRHVRMGDLLSNWRVVLNDSRILGNQQVVCEEIPAPQRATLAGYRRVAELLDPAGTIAQWAGIQLVVHPHADDFKPRDRVVPFDDLMARTNPTLVKFQFDVAQMARAGRNPVAELARYPNRFVSLHINDIGATSQEPAAPGSGRTDFRALLAAADRAGIRHYFVDDERADPTWDLAKANFTSVSAIDF